MALLKFIRRPHNELERDGRSVVQVHKDDNEPEKTCPNCRKSVPMSQLWANLNTCSCGHHFRLSARQRLRLLIDKDSFEEHFKNLTAEDVLTFPGYQQKLQTVRTATNEEEAVICGTATIGDAPCCLFVMDPYFMMGSMGVAVGEKIVRLFEMATEQKMPVVGYTVSGGARMQEGLFSLMQMAKTSAAVARHSEAGLFYLPVITSPTMGGVTASFAMEGDIILAEPGAMVGFAGARVIEQTTRKSLPKDFQGAEAMLAHGFIDAIVPRQKQKQVISHLLRLHGERSFNESNSL